MLKHYLDEDTISGRSYPADAQLADRGTCSDVEIARVICAAYTRVHEEKEKKKDGESRLMWSEGIARPIPTSKRSVQVKIAREIHAA